MENWRPQRWRYIVVAPDGQILFVKVNRLRKSHRQVGYLQEYRYDGFLSVGLSVFNFFYMPIIVRRINEKGAFHQVFGLTSEDPEEVFAAEVVINDKTYVLLYEEGVKFYATFSKRTGKLRSFIMKIYNLERTLRKFVIKL